eukprot:TRINITY_DN6318_c0_g1_i3.p1 TRINITY_DN6318_c0_g1~~TRINITY_DN6318_c0_g1_i3.p1  ORF type:complete len:215 (+),score=34.76 TRINITY_DN6318_c0_g1_i3:159-803(+)
MSFFKLNMCQIKINLNITMHDSSYGGKIEKAKADYKCEIHYIGEIVCGSLFPPNAELFCEVNLEMSNDWTLLNQFSQKFSFQTHCCTEVSEEGYHVWSHPFDIHLSTNSLTGWPKLLIRVWRLSLTKNLDIVGYGTCFLPNTAGPSEFTCETWRPRATSMEESQAFSLSGTPITSGADYMNMSSVDGVSSQSSGRVHVYCETILKNFKYLSIKT